MKTIEEVLNRMRQDPIPHLGQKSVQLIEPYEMGYSGALARWEKPPLMFTRDWNGFQSWIEQKFNWTGEMGCRQGPISFAKLISIDNQEAFDTYFLLRDDAQPSLPAITYEPPGCCTGQDLIDFIKEHVKNRPGMYLGGKSLDALWAMCSGFIWAERDLEIQHSATQNLMSHFQAWMEERYPFAKSQPWNRILNFLCLNNPDRAWEAFFDALESFQAGDAPDSLTATGRQMLNAIAQAILVKDPAADAEAIKAQFETITKNICST